jgi:hypothetical protein
LFPPPLLAIAPSSIREGTRDVYISDGILAVTYVLLCCYLRL